MGFDFTVEPRTLEWQDRIRAYVDDHVVPREQEGFTALTEDFRRDLQREAKERGIWAPQLSADLGGGGFAFDQAGVLLEEAGRSLFGALGVNAAAPDEGNLHLLDKVASAEQRERYLVPLAAGDIRSCFAMTEPAPGAGSDPAALATTATRTGDRWRIRGTKHFITGAEGAGVAIVMAATEGGATMFLVDPRDPGFRIVGHPRTLDTTMIGGHCRIEIDVEVGDDAVLGEPGKGFSYAQVRLAPARLTHCMRWLGAARRAHELAVAYASDRVLFGSAMTDLGMAQAMIADNEIDLAAARALVWQSSWQIARGDRSTESSSRTKVFVSEAVGRVVDRSVQLCGGSGTTEEAVVGRIYGDIRAFRIYDGSTETHKMSLARRAVRRGGRPA